MDEGLLSFEDAYAIGVKVAEMADRVKVGNKIVPGASAKWGFDMDDTHFSVTVTVDAPQA